MDRLSTLDDFSAFIRNEAALVYFSSADCGVCQTLKPRVFSELKREFPRIALAEVDCAAAPELAAQQGVFVAPVVAVFFDGSEQLRLARNFSPAALVEALQRPYALFFEG